MMRQRVAISGMIVIVSLIAAFSILTPRADAQAGASTMADIFCGTQYCYPGKCTPKDPGCVACMTITCTDTTNGKTTGKCVTSAPGLCKGESFSGGGQAGGGLGMEQLGQAISQLMQKLMQGGGGGGGGGGGQQPPTSPSAPGGCATTYQVTSPSSDPCAIYIPPVSSNLGGSNTGSSIDDLLSGSSGSGEDSSNIGTSISDLLSQFVNGSSTSSATTTRAQGTSTPNPFLQNNQAGLFPTGATGDIVLLNGGATIVVGSRDATSGTAVAGFLGSDSAFAQPKTIAGQLCQSRPWSTNFLSYIIPPSFFDNLCIWRGYQVGAQPAPSTTKVTVTQTAQQPVKQTTNTKPAATSTAPKVEPKIDIWAVPAAVSLGGRTSIFWNSQGVVSCKVTSPDGSFNQTTVSGGASTVALSGPTTFSMTCITPDGGHIDKSVTVKLAI